ncbi:hypothetical protein SALWKB2_1978 [Snodgrassella alvi wkB2]|nr:hypothetical protein SALWKB2_1978 [Snodgrassella alvi wkB2]
MFSPVFLLLFIINYLNFAGFIVLKGSVPENRPDAKIKKHKLPAD